MPVKNILLNVPDFVVVPEAIWDTRAPFTPFLDGHGNENEVYYALLLGLKRLVFDAASQDTSGPATLIFKPKNGDATSKRAWSGYKRGVGAHHGTPTIEVATRSLLKAVPAATEHAVVSHCGLFELYCQGWALNMLLAVLEKKNADRWSQAQRQLAQAFWPFHPEHKLPTFFDILKAFPQLSEDLSQLPHAFTNNQTREPLMRPRAPGLTALAAVAAWRAWRNLLVHHSGIVTKRFVEQHARFFSEARADFPLPEVKVGRPLTLNPEVFKGVTMTHYRAARHMKEILMTVSSDRRGHSLAPLPRGNFAGRAAPPLLCDGDEETSIRWATDREFRSEILRRAGLRADRSI